MNRRTGLIFITANAALYAGLVALYPLAQGLLKPRMTWAQQNGGVLPTAAAHIGIYVALTVLYAIAIEQAQRIGMEASADSCASAEASIPVALIVIGWLAFSLILLFSFPGESADIFDYIFRGRMLTEYGLSPLAHRPIEISNMPFHRYVSWSEWVDAYGPVWEYASAAVALAVKQLTSPAELLVHINQTCDVQPAVCTLLAKYVTGYRLFAVALTGVCGLLVSSIAQHMSSSRLAASAALALWLWNPLVLISTAIGAHNDVLMLVFVLLAVWLAQRNRWLLALLALFAAAHVKFTALVLLPMLCLWMAHRLGWKRATIATLAAIVIALPVSFALYAPLGGWATLPRNLYERSLLSANSLGELLYRFLRESIGLVRPTAQQLASRVSLVAFLAVCGPILAVAWRRKVNPKGLEDPSGFWLRIMIVVTLAYLALGSFWFQAWYLILPVALVTLLPTSKLMRVVLAYCVGAMLASVASDYLRASDVVPSWIVSVLVVGLILMPIVIMWITTWITTTSTPSRSSR